VTPFRLPVRVFMAEGCLSELEPELRRLGASRVLLVTDSGLLGTPWPEQVTRAVNPVLVDAATRPNPRVEDINMLACEAREAGIDAVVGLGGGSVLDAAKAVAVLITNPGPDGDMRSIVDLEGKNRFEHAAAPFLAIPTTCGTGSEVTWVSVISDPDSRRKLSVKGDGMFAAAAFADARLIETLPDDLVATTAMDAVTHAIEAAVGRAANPTSDGLAAAALGRLLPALETFASRGERDHPRLMEGATIAGMAFGNADVGAVHCLSEAIGGVLDLPHGLLNAVLLAPVLRYTQQEIEEPLSRLLSSAGINAEGAAVEMTGAERVAAFIDRIDTLRCALGLPSVDGLGIDTRGHAELARLAEQNGSNVSCRRDMTADDYLRLLSVS